MSHKTNAGGPTASAVVFSSVLAAIPEGLRLPLLNTYNAILKNFRESRWEPAELNGGKFCETVYCILKGHVDGAFPAGPSKPANMVDACKAFEQVDGTKFSRSIRIQIPRMLVALYEIRNNRGVGHIGGDVNPNHMDSIAVVQMVKWILAELIRVFHGVSADEASAAVDALVDRSSPLVWEVNGVRRVLSPGMPYREQVLLLAYHTVGPVLDSNLFAWIEHPDFRDFKRKVLRKAHDERLIEYDSGSGRVYLSPAGVQQVEKYLLAQN
jgi:hypothetical protein